MKTSDNGRGWRHSQGWRHASVLSLASVIWLGAAPAWAQAAPHGDAHTGSGTGEPVVFGLLSLLGTALVAGIALVRPLTGEPGPQSAPTTTRVAWLAAWIVVASGLISLVLGTASLLPTALHAVAVVLVVLGPRRRVVAALGGLALVGLLLVEFAAATETTMSTVDFLVGAGYRVGMVLVFGVAVGVLTSSSQVAQARRLAPVAVVAVLALAGSVVTGSVVPEPGDPRPGVALLARVTVAGHELPVLVAPHRPGPNLVNLGGHELGEVRVGTDPGNLVTASARRGTTGTWALVQLPAGADELVIEHDGERDTIDIDPGDGLPGPPSIAGPDGPECAEEALGAAITEIPYSSPACPSEALTPSDEADLRRLVDFLAGRRIPAVAIDADNSPRSVAAASVVRRAAEGRLAVVSKPGPDDALVLVSGWDTANVTLTDVAARQYTRAHGAGTYLAPWLLSAPVITGVPGMLVPLPFDPRSEQPVRYEVALAVRFPGKNPSTAGYRGWLAATDTAANDRAANDSGTGEGTRLYAASLVAIMPGSLGHKHGGDGGWFPGGTVVPVSGRLE
jgi:hypothetical protein